MSDVDEIRHVADESAQDPIVVEGEVHQQDENEHPVDPEESQEAQMPMTMEAWKKLERELDEMRAKAEKNLEETIRFKEEAKRNAARAEEKLAKAQTKDDAKLTEASAWLTELSSRGNVSMAEYMDAAKRAAAGKYVPEEELSRGMSLSTALPQHDYQPDGGLKDVVMATAKTAGDLLKSVRDLGAHTPDETVRIYQDYLEESVLGKVSKMLERSTEVTESNLMQRALGLVDDSKHGLVAPPALGSVAVDKKMREGFLMAVDTIDSKSGGIEFTKFLERARDYIQNAKTSERSAYHLMSEALKNHEALHLQLRVCERQSVPFHEAWMSIQAADLSGQDAMTAKTKMEEMMRSPPKDIALVASRIEDLACRAEANIRSKSARNRAIERRITDAVVNYVNKYNLALAGKIAERAKFLDIRQEKTMEECAKRKVDYDAVTSKFDHPGWGLTYWLRTQKGWTGAHGRVGDKDEVIRVSEVDYQQDNKAVDRTPPDAPDKPSMGSSAQLVIDELRSVIKKEIEGTTRKLRQANNDKFNQLANKVGKVDKHLSDQERIFAGVQAAKGNGPTIPAYNQRPQNNGPGPGFNARSSGWTRNKESPRNAARTNTSRELVPSRGIVCYLCGIEGHVASQCYTYPGDKVGYVVCHLCGNRHTSACRAVGAGPPSRNNSSRQDNDGAPPYASGQTRNFERGPRWAPNNTQ